MTTDRAPGSTRPQRRRTPRAGSDDGFSLLEVLVALAVIGLVMAGTAPFLTRSVSVVGQQRTQQVAIEVANDALERARALSPSSLLAGRGLTAVQNQLTVAHDDVKAIMSSTRIDADSTVDSTAGVNAPLPTAPLPVTVGGVQYQQRWYVGRCWQTKADPAQSSADVGNCVGTEPTGGAVPFFRVVVAVTWEHNGCTPSPCSYIASTLVSPGADPVFDLKRPPPTIANPGAQGHYVGESVSFQLAAAGGSLPRTWTLTGLPPGLAVTAAGLITGAPTTAGTYTVAAHVQDRDARGDDATFTWTVANSPSLTSPGAQVFRTTRDVPLQVPLTGGLAPLAWTATGLPPGLTINPSTGVISGTPTTEQRTPQTATITVAAKGPRSATTTFTWRVLTPVRLILGTTYTANKGDNGAYNLAQGLFGGLGPYTWTVTGLPPGMTYSASNGTTSGIISAGTRYVATATVTDSAGGTATATAVVNVNTTGLRVTTPDPANPDRTSTVGSTVSLTAQATGAAGLTWSATGLPPGLTMTGATVSGTPTTAGTYTTTLTVTGDGQVANLMLVWRVNP